MEGHGLDLCRDPDLLHAFGSGTAWLSPGHLQQYRVSSPTTAEDYAKSSSGAYEQLANSPPKCSIIQTANHLTSGYLPLLIIFALITTSTTFTPTTVRWSCPRTAPSTRS